MLLSKSSKHDLSISLRHGQPQRTTRKASSRWSLEKTDLIAPEDVCRAELQSIQLDLNFLSVSGPNRTKKENEAAPQDKSLDLRVDQASVNETTDHVAELEDVVRRINSLPISVAANFQTSASNLKNGATAFKEVASPTTHDSKDRDTPVSSSKTSQRKRKNFSAEIKHVLNAWLESHVENPYPTAGEKQQLMILTGLSKGYSETKFSVYMS